MVRAIIRYLILLVWLACPALGEVRNVPSDYLAIQAAIDDSNDGDIVIVAPGTYTGDGNRDIDFKGKAIIVKSEDGHETCIINCQGTRDDYHRGFLFHCNESADSILDGFSIINGHTEYGGAGITCYSSPCIRNCIVKGNKAQGTGAGIQLSHSNATFDNCLVSGNYGYAKFWNRWIGGGIYCGEGHPVFRNCTIVGNRTEEMEGGGIACVSSRERGVVVLENCIITGNIVELGPFTKGTQIVSSYPLNHMGTNIMSVEIKNNCIENDPNAIFVQDWPNPSEPPVGSYIKADPIFAKPGYWDPNGTHDDPNDDVWIDGDYHLKSQAGRWDPVSQSWVQDDVTSPCIDAGDPNTPVGDEPFPNGGIINIGAYGGTAEASKSYFGEPVCETIIAGDINGDCKVDFKDFQLMALHWLE